MGPRAGRRGLSFLVVAAGSTEVGRGRRKLVGTFGDCHLGTSEEAGDEREPHRRRPFHSEDAAPSAGPPPARGRGEPPVARRPGAPGAAGGGGGAGGAASGGRAGAGGRPPGPGGA